MNTDNPKDNFTGRGMLLAAALSVAPLIYVAVLVLQGPAADAQQPAGVNPELLVAFQADPGALTVIDARSVEEHAASSIPGAINVPHDDVEARRSALPADTGETILVHCRTGKRAGLLKEQLVAMGYTDVQVLPSEQIEWSEDGPVGLNPDAASESD